MRIESLRINNVLGIRALDRKFSAPVVLFAGRNHVGKSSICEAVRMAIEGSTERVVLKKEYPRLVADGAKEGEVIVTVDGTVIRLALPDGNTTPWAERPSFLRPCLDPAWFAELAGDERREFLFHLVGLKTDGQAVVKRLVDKGLDPKRVEEVAEVLKDGFSAGHDFASERAREAKGAWRFVTGEQWGKDKAAAWAPPPITFTDVEAEILKRVQVDYATAQEEERVAGNEVAALERVATTVTAGADAKKATRVKDLTEQLVAKSAERDALKAQLAHQEALSEGGNGMACPHCGGMVVQDGFTLKAYEGPNATAKHEAKAAVARFRDSLRLMDGVVKNVMRDLDDAREHAARLAAEKGMKIPTPHEVQKAKETHVLLTDKCRSLREEEKRLLVIQGAASVAGTKAKAAADHHTEVVAWLAIADALAPSGIQAEILATALKPVNDKLREAAVMTGWRQVAIDADMEIVAEGRSYRLLSESERWRADAMLAYMIASFGPKFVMFDRLDVLDLNGRGEAMAWLTALVKQGRLHGAIVCATLKAPPTVEGVDAYWLESGQVVDLKAAA